MDNELTEEENRELERQHVFGLIDQAKRIGGMEILLRVMTNSKKYNTEDGHKEFINCLELYSDVER